MSDQPYSSSYLERGGAVNGGAANRRPGDPEKARQFHQGLNTSEGQDKKAREAKMEHDELLAALALNLNIVGSGNVAQRLQENRDRFSALYSSPAGFVLGTGQAHDRFTGSMEKLRNDVANIRQKMEGEPVHTES